MGDTNLEAIDRHVLKRYELDTKLGKGAYGIVWRATDRKSKQPVALKKIFDAFQNSTDAQRTYREVMFLQEMKAHENIISLLNVLKADNDRDLYLVFEFMETDLNAAIKSRILQDVHKQYIMFQAFVALRYMHERGLVHRDMKPANLLLNSACLMKVCDFGLARSTDGLGENLDDRPLMTDYVATRWYRAPEILVGSSKYGAAVDMWSMGCILAEMVLERPLFSGTSTINQLEKVMVALGWPHDTEIDAWESPFAKTIIDSCASPDKPRIHFSPEQVRQSLRSALSRGSGERNSDDSAAVDEQDGRRAAIDLLAGLVAYNPQARHTPLAGMQHEYCGKFFVKEPPSGLPSRHVNKCLTFSDSQKGSTAQYRDALYTQVRDIFAGQETERDGGRGILHSRRGYGSMTSHRSRPA